MSEFRTCSECQRKTPRDEMGVCHDHLVKLLAQAFAAPPPREYHVERLSKSDPALQIKGRGKAA
jgi:hypothetical protein